MQERGKEWMVGNKRRKKMRMRPAVCFSGRFALIPIEVWGRSLDRKIDTWAMGKHLQLNFLNTAAYWSAHEERGEPLPKLSAVLCMMHVGTFSDTAQC